MVMRKLILVLACLMVLVFAVVSDADITPDSIVALWLFDEGDGETLIDSSDNQHDGNIIGAPGWEEGMFGLALDVNSATYVRVPHDEGLSLETYTITLWLASESSGGWVPVFSKSAGNETRNYAIFFIDGTGAAGMSVSNGNAWVDVSGEAKANDGEWHHIALVFDKDDEEATIFFDGEEKNKAIMAGGPHISENDIVFAAWHSTAGGNEGYVGKFDEVGIFSTILTQEEIQNIMATGLEQAIGVSAVEPSNKLPITWATIKAQ